LSRIAAAAASYAGLIFAAGFVLGTLRVLVLVPRIGAVWAEAIEVPIMLALSFLVARWQVARHGVPARLPPRLAMGGLAFILLMSAEIVLGVIGFGQPLAEVLTGYGDPRRWIGLGGQIAFGLMPVLLLLRGTRP
jgi:hypothetical protein